MEPAALTPLNALAAYVAVGALAGILAGLLGVGGGLIIVPALIWAFRAQGVDDAIVVHLAVGTSLATIVPTSLSAVYAHHRRGAVLWDLVARLAPGMVLGA
ncbi:MAG: TSUP family transporter, partial [Chromatiales bacterium]